MSKAIKELSRVTWTTTEEGWPGYERIYMSCLMRIADAMEKTAANYDHLRRDKEWYEKRCDSLVEEVRQLKYAQAGYKAALTRLRRSAAARSEPSH